MHHLIGDRLRRDDHHRVARAAREVLGQGLLTNAQAAVSATTVIIQIRRACRATRTEIFSQRPGLERLVMACAPPTCSATRGPAAGTTTGRPSAARATGSSRHGVQ